MKFVTWLNNVRLSIKMLIIGIFAIICIVLPSYFYVSAALQTQNAEEREIEGLPHAVSMLGILKNIAEHRGIAAQYFGGNTQIENEKNSKFNKVKLNIKSFSGHFKSYTKNQQLIDDVQLMEDAFESLKDITIGTPNSGALSLKQHANLINSAEVIIQKIMQESGLSYDPSANSYHLIIAGFEKLPRLIDSLGQVRGVGASILTKGEASDSDKTKILLLLANIAKPYADYTSHINAASNNNKSLEQLTKGVKLFDDKIALLKSLSQQEIIDTKRINFSPDKYFQEYTKVINDFINLNYSIAEKLSELLNKRIEANISQRNTSLAIIIILALVASLLGYLIVHSIVSMVNRLVITSQQMSEGNFDHDIEKERKDELGILSATVAIMNVQLSIAKDAANESLRVKQALDIASTNVMIADDDRKIIYLNEAVKSMLKIAESDLKQALPNFSSSSVLNSNMDIFHKNPSHQADLLSKLKNKYETQIAVGGRHFRLTANPIISNTGERLGTVVEWLDRTAEINAEEEVSRIVKAAVQGDFTERAETTDKNGFMLNMAEGLNSLIETTDQGLADIARVLNAIAKGDMTEIVDKEYLGTFASLANYCNTTTENLSGMIYEIRQAADIISSASTEISQGNNDLSNRTEQQASSLEETAASMEELTGTVRLNSENASQANGLASEASTVAIEGGELIQQVVTTMSSINESARKISDIIGVIDGIAFQTNILALNAAVEAARAGEQGRGFAVVASEVRSLAQRSANAAKDIKELISDSVQKIENGNALVNQSGATMDKVVISIKRVNDIMAEIAAASAEQATGIDEVSKAVTDMDEVTQQNAALVEEAAAAAESLQSQAQQLATRVASFKLDDSYSTQEMVKPPQRLASSSTTAKINGRVNTPVKRIKPADPIEDEWESF
jgi:methyl-accepting chemotaxis protein